MVRVLELGLEGPGFGTRYPQRPTEYIGLYVLIISVVPKSRRREHTMSPKVPLGAQVSTSSLDRGSKLRGLIVPS